jgi:hypothetical protein
MQPIVAARVAVCNQIERRKSCETVIAAAKNLLKGFSGLTRSLVAGHSPEAAHWDTPCFCRSGRRVPSDARHAVEVGIFAGEPGQAKLAHSGHDESIAGQQLELLTEVGGRQY